MNTPTTRLTAIVTSFALIAFVLSAWCKQPASGISKELRASHKKKVMCAGSASRSVFLAEIRTRQNGAGSPGLVCAWNKTFALSQGHASIKFDKKFQRRTSTVRPLWLINQSFLI